MPRKKIGTNLSHDAYDEMGDTVEDSVFDQVEKKTKVKKEDLVKLAKSLNGKNLNDEKVLRNLIHDVASLAGKPVSKEKEEKIIDAVKKDKIPKSFKGMM